MPDPNLEYELEQAAQNARPFTNARLAPAQMPVDEEELAAAYESARPIPPPAPPVDYPMEGSGYSPEPPAPGPEYGPDPGRAQVNIGTASRFGTDWGPGENDFGVPGGQRVYGDVPEGMSLQPRIGWQMESQSAAQRQAEAARAQAEQQAAARLAADPQAQLAQLNRLIQQTALSQPEQMRLATLNQAVSQIQTQLDNGSISQDTARRLHAQVTHNAEQLWARQGSLPEMLQRQRYLQAMHDAAEQQSISTHAQYHASQTAQGRLPVAQARLADGTMADFVEESPGRWRHLTAPGGAQQDRAQAQAEQRHQNLVNRTQEHVLGELNHFETALHRWQAQPAETRGARPEAPHWMRNELGQNYSRDFAVGEEVRRRVGQVHELAGTQPPTPRQGGQPGQQGPGQPQGGGPAPQLDGGPAPQAMPTFAQIQQVAENFRPEHAPNAQPFHNALRTQLAQAASMRRDNEGPVSGWPAAEQARYRALNNQVLATYRELQQRVAGHARATEPLPWWGSFRVGDPNWRSPLAGLRGGQ